MIQQTHANGRTMNRGRRGRRLHRLDASSGTVGGESAEASPALVTGRTISRTAVTLGRAEVEQALR